MNGANDALDTSYTSKLGKMTADEYGELIAARRKQAARYFAQLPAALSALPDKQLEILDPAIRDALLAIEAIKDTWTHKLASDELLGQEFDETTAAIWPCSRATGAFLHMMIRATKPRLVLELGTSVGYSTLWMAAACRETGGRITTIEYLPEKVKMARQYFAACKVDDLVELIQGDIREVLDTWTGSSPDLVFMDPNKEWQKHYLAQLAPLMKPGSMLITDNAFDSHDIAEEYVQNLQNDYLSIFAGLDTAGTLISIKK